MKKLIAVVLALVLLAGVGIAEEAAVRTLPEGKYIIGRDIEPGLYTLTCVETAGEQLNDAYGALGNAFNALDHSQDYSSIFGAFGGLMETLVGTTVEIIGDYGDVLDSYEMKTGDSIVIRLEEETALSITDGRCAIAPTTDEKAR